MMRAVLLVLCAACLPEAMADEASCRATEPLRIRVRFAGEAPRDVLVESMSPSGLRLLDSTSREEIWSAGPAVARSQQFSHMDSSFGESLAAVHLDADGVHDRLYAGDRAGRLWRMDLRAGAARGAWMEAAVLADLGVPGGGRGFVARADVSRIEVQGGTSWLSIAIGTANTGVPRNDHRFYVLRDAVAGRLQAPLVEADLDSLSPPAGSTRGNTRGYYLPLGAAQVLAQSLTLNGRIHFTAVESARNLLAMCAADTLPAMEVPLSVTVLRARDGEIALEERIDGSTSSPSLRRPLANPLPASTGVELAKDAAPNGLVACLIGADLLPGCFLDTRPTRTWWRREDAD